MGFLLKKLPGAPPNCMLRDSDGVMKKIRPEGTYFLGRPAGIDHYIGVEEMSEKDGAAHEAKCRAADEKARADYEAYVAAKEAAKASGVEDHVEVLRRDIAHIDEELAAIDEQVEDLPGRRPAADKLKATLREKQKELRHVLFERTGGKEGEARATVTAPAPAAPAFDEDEPKKPKRGRG